MRLESRLLGLAAAVAAAVSYAICALAVAIAPRAVADAFSYVLHIDLTGLARRVTWDSFIVGIIAFSLVIGLLVALAATIYNALLGRAVSGETHAA
ncbi:MAG TPA: DUF5676 family membrane protein [Longimicrobiales bacterium]|nr:DUF5676 family membrane protein [Longimicrobiales bacterium]